MDTDEQKDADLETGEQDTEETVEEGSDAQPEKKTYTTEQKYARVSRLQQKYAKELGIEPTIVKVEYKTEPSAKTNELDENALDFLDLKGITEDEDVAVIQKVIEKTGQTVRQALKDDYVIQKLEANKTQRANQMATPSSTRRAGQTSTQDIGSLVDKYERTNELPDDFETRSKVVEAVVNKNNPNRPPWRK